MECSRDTKDKMFKGKNQTEENKWLLETPFCKLQIFTESKHFKTHVKFIVQFFCLIKIIKNQSLFKTTWLINVKITYLTLLNDKLS